MKRIFFGLLSVLIIASSSMACRKSKESAAQNEVRRIRSNRNMQVVTNENEPRQTGLLLRFEEDLSLIKEGWWPAQIRVDSEGNISVLQPEENSLCQFNSQGIEVSTRRFPKGQEPGGFNSMDLGLAADRRLFVYDQSQFRLTIMAPDCAVQKILKFGEMRWEFSLDSKEQMYFWTVKFLPKTKDAQRLVLSKYSPSGELLSEIMEYAWSIYLIRGENIEYKHPLFKPYGTYKIGPANAVYYTMSDRYEINIVSDQGELLRRIIKKGSARRVTEKDIEIALRDFPWALKPRSEIVIPELMPSIADFFILRNGYLLVITFENGLDENSLSGDLFDSQGIFQAHVKVPKYCDWFSLIGPRGIGRALAEGDHFYTIEADAPEEIFSVKRYKVIWGRAD